MSEHLDPPLKNVLAKCLAEVAELRPADPIDYLARCLYRHSGSEIAYHNKRIMITEMELARLQLEEEQVGRMERLSEMRETIKVLKGILGEQKTERAGFLKRESSVPLGNRTARDRADSMAGQSSRGLTNQHDRDISQNVSTAQTKANPGTKTSKRKMSKKNSEQKPGTSEGRMTD